MNDIARLVRKFGIFLVPKIANRLRQKQLKNFIFFDDSKIVQACLVLSALKSRRAGVIWINTIQLTTKTSEFLDAD